MAGKLSKVNLNDYKPLRRSFSTLRGLLSLEAKARRKAWGTVGRKMGVSRTPVREAIRKLELEGLVEMMPRKGAHVADLSVGYMDVLIRSAVDWHLHLRLPVLRRMKLRSCYIFATICQLFEKENHQGQIKKDVEFHDIIYRASGNDKHSDSNNLREQVQRFRVIYIKDYSIKGTNERAYGAL